MEILHGFIIFLAVKICASTDVVQGVHGSFVSLECPLNSSNHNYQWQVFTGGSWSATITSNSKYNNANMKHLIINDLAVSDSGTYRCTVSPHGQGYVNLTVSDPGTWSEWGAWGDCTVTCGVGDQSRRRQCLTTSCIGSNSETRDCNTSPCPVPGTWSTWGGWGTCTLTCGVGQQSRTRQCLVNPCTGNHIQTLDCNTFPCPVHGNWGHWFAGPCSVTCSNGQKRSYRSCDSPAPSNGGNYCQGNSEYYELCNDGKCPDYEKSSTPVGGVIAGAISAFVVLLGVAGTALFILHKRRQKELEKHNDYAVTDMKQGEEHFYIQTRAKDDYCNTDLRSPVETENNEGLSVEYNSSELSKLLLNKHVCEKTMKDEFQELTKIRPLENVIDYEEVTEHDLNETVTSYDRYIKTTMVKQLARSNMSLVAETPTKNTIEMFWTLVNNFKVQDIILVVRKKETVTDFFPLTDEAIEMHGLELKMISSDRQQNHIFTYLFELTDQRRNTASIIRLYKTTNWKIGDTFPDISTLCKLMTTPDANSAGVLMIGSKGIAYRICGVLSVCLEAVKKIRDDKKISILQIAMDIVKICPDLFQTFEEYELCYNILRHYMENEHYYAIID